MNQVYSVITKQITTALERGVVPWRKPWTLGAAKNLVSGRAYRGINALMLPMRDFPSPYWLSFRQAATLGGSVRKGEVSTPIIFWKQFPAGSDPSVLEETERGEKVSRGRQPWVMRYYPAFNASQCNGLVSERLVEQPALAPTEAQEKAERIVRGMVEPPTIQTVTTRASYSAALDRVSVPAKTSFESVEAYYATLFHELVHSTGHVSRLARPGLTNTLYGSDPYAQEELVAEIGASFLCGASGIANSVIDNAAAYVAGWLAVLQNDVCFVSRAAASAQRAADYMLASNEPVEEV
jgi:antirestriction protein ArdC